MRHIRRASTADSTEDAVAKFVFLRFPEARIGRVPRPAKPAQCPVLKFINGMTPTGPFTDVATAIEEIRAGRMIVVVDDEDRENEGDLTLAAEKVTPDLKPRPFVWE